MLRKTTILIISILFSLAASISFAQDFTLDDAKELTEKAATLILTEGMEKARPILHDLNGGYRKGEKGELYVAVIDHDGVWLAYPPRPAGVGKNVLNAKDADGKFLVKDMINVSKTKGSGWVEYRWLDPKTNKIRPKVTYVKQVENQGIFVAAGIYK